MVDSNSVHEVNTDCSFLPRTFHSCRGPGFDKVIDLYSQTLEYSFFLRISPGRQGSASKKMVDSAHKLNTHYSFSFRELSTRRTDHLQIDQMDPNPPLSHAVEDLYCIGPTQESYSRSCRCIRPPPGKHELDHTCHTGHIDHLPWNI